MEMERLIVTHVAVQGIVQIAMEKAKQDALHPAVPGVDAPIAPLLAKNPVRGAVVGVETEMAKDALFVVDLVKKNVVNAVDLDPAEHVMEQEWTPVIAARAQEIVKHVVALVKLHAAHVMEQGN